MLDNQPTNFLIDITPLFNIGCSKKAIDLTTDYVGGFDKLTDLCCHVAIMQLKNYDHDNISNVIGQALSTHAVHRIYTNTMHDVVLKYTNVLYRNFVNILLTSATNRTINHIEVHDARFDFNNTTLQRQNVTTQLKATLHWY